ncbi:hypothetical protein AX769_01075 [Frondihabitans sp. PAMC 28766]|uniref:WXG100 family type VII secretion target n=1 Tax=Frondihabitans sp. PAMC 28766 TaxID=1795630 RepID=UPI00078CAE33|nr:WXG100 family type VII secretion target [Frondihabitans sp. PAMC 28766]AMM18987.1 hypothetical protein AX769_01075 [Frondihabitans sp. PAMC 28766]
MPAYEVDLDQLDTVRHDVQNLVDYCESLRAEIRQAAASLTDFEWTGSASAQFDALQQTWQDGAAKIQAGLAVMTANAAASHANYSAVQAANARLWGR